MPKMPVSAVIDAAPMSSFQQRVVALCLLLSLAEGLNALSIGYAIPSLANDYGSTAAAFSIVFVASLIGEMVGQFFIAPLADRYGRRKVLRVGIVVFGVAAILSAMVGSVGALAACRLFAGIGVGTTLPSVYALASEYTPSRSKGTVLATLSMSLSAGGVLAGLLATQLVPGFGGQSLLFVGGLVPLALLAATWKLVPESIEFLADQGRHDEVRARLERITPGQVPPDAQFAATERATGVIVGALFRSGRSGRTIFAWLMSFFGVFNAYFIFSFLAVLLIDDGIVDETALLSTTVATFGGMVGAVTLGFLMDRSRIGSGTGTVGCLASALALVLMATSIDSSTNTVTVVILGFVLGYGAIGANALTSVIAAQIYPASMRATGFGWFSGVGRFGGLLAPVVVGAILAAGNSPQTLFLLATIPICGLGFLLALYRVRYGKPIGDRPTDSTIEISPATAH